MRGIALRDLPVVPDGPAGLRAALGGFELCHVPGMRWFSPDLDPSTMDDLAAELSGIRLAAGLGPINAAHLERATDATELGDGDPVRGWHRLIEAAARMAVDSLHFTVGTLADRFAGDWPAQLDATAELVRPLVRVAEDLGLPLVLKTHEEMTTFELLRFADATGVRAGFSPVNLLTRLEHPVAAARRVAPLVHTVFLDDAAVTWTPDGLARRMRPIGEGAVPWPEVLARLPGVPVVLDLHRAELDMPVHRPDWPEANSDLTVSELFSIARLTVADAPSTPLEHRRERGLKALAAIGATR